MRYEILSGDTVVNTVNASPEFMAAQYPDGNYREVAASAPTPKTAGLTENEYYALFTAAEQAKWFDYCDNKTLPPGGVTGPQRQTLAVARGRLEGLMRSGGGIDLSHLLVVSAVNTMNDCGFLDSAGRVEQILCGISQE